MHPERQLNRVQEANPKRLACRISCRGLWHAPNAQLPFVNGNDDPGA